jgi:4-hydroxy-3-methylbut-2-enyl diphosphate reductase
MLDAIDILVVVGSKHSSNSMRLFELGAQRGISSYFIDTADEIDSSWFTDKKNLGITSGASVPERLVQGVIDRLRTWFPAIEVRDVEVIRETAFFPLPKELGKE